MFTMARHQEINVLESINDEICNETCGAAEISSKINLGEKKLNILHINIRSTKKKL